MIALTIILGLLLLVAIFVIVNMYRKLIVHEDWEMEIRVEMHKVLNTMKVLDNKQLFEKDDEVGELWTAVATAVRKIDTFLVPEHEADESGETENVEEIEAEKEEFIVE